MDKQTALDFLRLHQPMPAQLSDQLVAEFRAVREFLRDHPCDEALEPLLRSLNEGDGAGEYPLVDEVLGAADDAAAVAAIRAVLEDPSTDSGARFWATLFSVSFVRKELIASLETSLKYANDDLIELTKEQIEMFKQLA